MQVCFFLTSYLQLNQEQTCQRSKHGSICTTVACWHFVTRHHCTIVATATSTSTTARRHYSRLPAPLSTSSSDHASTCVMAKATNYDQIFTCFRYCSSFNCYRMKKRLRKMTKSPLTSASLNFIHTLTKSFFAGNIDKFLHFLSGTTSRAY